MNKFFWTKYNFVGCQIKIHWLIIKTTKNENITKDNLTQIETENCLQVFFLCSVFAVTKGGVCKIRFYNFKTKTKTN